MRWSYAVVFGRCLRCCFECRNGFLCMCVVLEAVRVVHVIICKCVVQRGVASIPGSDQYNEMACVI